MSRRKRLLECPLTVIYNCWIVAAVVGDALTVSPAPRPDRIVGWSRRSFLSRHGANLFVGTAVASVPSWVLPTSTHAVSTKSGESLATRSALEARLERDILQQLPLTGLSERTGSVDNTYYPDFLEGTWDVTQTLVNVQAPLGAKFLGGPNGDVAIAEQSLAESRSRLGQPVRLSLRYSPTPWGIAEDRVYNTIHRLDAFAGRVVVASADYADVAAANRATVLALGGTVQDPLPTVVVRFKGPAAQKTFVTMHAAERVSPTSWIGVEGNRAIFALTNQSTAPPVFTDSELVWKFERLGEGRVRGKLRIVGYLNAQSDKLYFEARNRAVSIQDYTLEMKRTE